MTNDMEASMFEHGDFRKLQMPQNSQQHTNTVIVKVKGMAFDNLTKYTCCDFTSKSA